MSNENIKDGRIIKTPSGVRAVNYETGKQMIAAGLAWEPSPTDVWDYIRENTAPSLTGLRDKVEAEYYSDSEGDAIQTSWNNALDKVLSLLPKHSGEQKDVLAEVQGRISKYFADYHARMEDGDAVDLGEIRHEIFMIVENLKPRPQKGISNE